VAFQSHWKYVCHHSQPGVLKRRKLIVDQGGLAYPVVVPQWNGRSGTIDMVTGEATQYGGLWLARMLHGDDSAFEFDLIYMYSLYMSPVLEGRKKKPSMHLISRSRGQDCQ
jgi:hypothetical protein